MRDKKKLRPSAACKLLQAMDRLVLLPEGRGMALNLALILDRRAGGFERYLEGLRVVANPVAAVREFFDQFKMIVTKELHLVTKGRLAKASLQLQPIRTGKLKGILNRLVIVFQFG